MASKFVVNAECRDASSVSRNVSSLWTSALRVRLTSIHTTRRSVSPSKPPAMVRVFAADADLGGDGLSAILTWIGRPESVAEPRVIVSVRDHPHRAATGGHVSLSRFRTFGASEEGGHRRRRWWRCCAPTMRAWDSESPPSVRGK